MYRLPFLFSYFICICVSVFGNHYQQSIHSSVSSGYNKKTQILYQQHGVWSNGPHNISSQLTCTQTECQIPQLQMGYYPPQWRLDFGYLARFDSAILVKKQPFLGFSFARPNNLACKPTLPKAWQPWIGVRAHTNSQLSIADTTQILYLGQVDPSFYTIARNPLPAGSYPVSVTMVDSDGATTTLNQFVDTPLRKPPHSKAFSINLGWPVDKVPKGSFGLPPLSEDTSMPMAFASYTQPWKLGLITSYLGVAESRFQFGLRQITSIGSFALAPEFLIQRPVTRSQEDIYLATGSQISWLPNNNTAAQLSMYGYPESPTDQDYPTVIHAQYTQQQDRWKGYITKHWSEKTVDRYWQTKLSIPLQLYHQWDSTASWLADYNAIKKTSNTFRLEAHQRSQSTNKIQFIGQSNRQKISLLFPTNTSTTQNFFLERKKNRPSRYTTGWSSTYTDTRVQGLLKLKFSPGAAESTQWAFEVKSGFSYTDGMIFWHNLSNPWQNYQITIPYQKDPPWLWWVHKTCAPGYASIRSHPSYAPKGDSEKLEISNAYPLYPGNLFLQQEPNR